MKGISVIIPALNEEITLGSVIEEIDTVLKKTDKEFEIIVVDDGSDDRTGEIAKSRNVRLIQHPIPGGYGLSLRDGIINSCYDSVVIIDADGTYPAKMIPGLIGYLEQFDMVVGARTGPVYRGSLIKNPLRLIFQMLCEFVTGVKIPDANSGFRAFRKEAVLKFKENFCLGFSFTTTITLAFHLNGFFVKYIPIEYYRRAGKSHVRLIKDGLRTSQIITEAILYYNPLKLFLLISILFFLIALIAFLVYFSGKSIFALLLGLSFLTLSVLFFGMGLVSQVIKKIIKENHEIKANDYPLPIGR